jgi:hypothetical protein
MLPGGHENVVSAEAYCRIWARALLISAEEVGRLAVKTLVAVLVEWKISFCTTAGLICSPDCRCKICVSLIIDVAFVESDWISRLQDMIRGEESRYHILGIFLGEVDEIAIYRAKVRCQLNVLAVLVGNGTARVVVGGGVDVRFGVRP